jgi:predicted extracellular nuclease
MLRLLPATLVAFVLLPAAAAQAAPVVISEFRFRGPDGGSDEFIELRNTTATPQAIGGWKLRGCSSGGTVGDRATIAAGVTLPPGGAYLLTNSSSSGGPYSGSVPGDQTYSSGIADNGGMRLENGAGVLQDAVGSSSVVGTANCREAGGIVGIPTSNGDNSYERIGGVQDTDDNAADFAGPKAGNPQNSQPTTADDGPEVQSTDPDDGEADVSPGTNVTVTFSEPVTAADDAFSLTCDGTAVAVGVTRQDADTYVLDPQSDLPEAASCTLAVEGDRYRDDDGNDPPDAGTDHSATFSTIGIQGLRIHDIQAASHLSPYEDAIVHRVPGVVTAVRSTGFYMQDDQPDGNRATSEGILVFTGSRPALDPGDRVEVSGTVNEFRGGCDSGCDPGNSAFDNLTITELDRATVYPAGETDPLAPTPVGAGGYEPPLQVFEDDALGNVEIGNVLFDPEEDGLDWHESLEGMLVEIAAPEVVGLRPSFGELPVVSRGAATLRTPRGGVVIQEGDMNPERFILEDVLAPTPTANVGDTLGESVVAIADYGFGDYLYYPTSRPTVTPGNLQREVTEPKRANQLAIASMNVENLDGLDDQDKYDELATIVVDNLLSPDILAVEEMQDNDGAASEAPTDATVTYNRFIAAIESAGGPRYEFRQVNPNAGTDGGEPGGNIRVGFLYRTDGDVQFVDRPGATADTANRVIATRKGARLEYSPGRIDPTNEAFEDSRKPLAAEFLWKGRTVFAIANHFNSKGGDDPLGGRFQPPVQHSTVQRHKQATVVAGFVEDLLEADPRAAAVVLGDLNDFQFSETLEILEDAGLANLMETLPAEEQYSYVFDGNSQVLDQILVTKELLTPAPEYDSVHVNAEFADQASDHDPQIARLVVRGTGNANGQ